ncbi:MAG: response regulator [Deltaproteobacteria bacterium]|nr:response regulator [Deltaproteobacteria bacterium]
MDNKGTILVVDDALSAISMVRTALEQAGYQVSVATSGEKAVQRAALVMPDLILLDILMPGIDGYETCRRLKAQEATRGIPVIFLSALTETFDKVTGFGLGAVDYLIKPIAPEELLARVRTHVTVNHLGKELQAANRHLEERVAARTADLRAANATLQLEIAERKRAEEDLHQANRMLKILSEGNQTVIHATEETALLQEICRIVVEIGGYLLAWVGFVEQDDAKGIRPMAASGLDISYLDTVNLTWADTERGRGPTGRAIRSGRPQIASDIRTDPDFSPWREEAIRRGYGSSVVLPLYDGDQVVGALMIYASKPDAFHPKEVELLMELAHDLAFGISSLRARADRKLAEKALRESEQRYRRIVDTTNEGILALDEKVRITFANPRMAEMLDFQMAEMLGRDFASFILEEELPDHARKMEARRQGLAEQYERRFLCKNGQVVWTLVSATPIFDAGHQFIGSFGMFTDITERKRMEEEQARLEQQLRQAQKMEAIGTFAGGVAHDFNNVLTAIVGYGQLTRQELGERDPLRGYVDIILSASERAANLTQSLLAFSRKRAISPRPVDLNEIVKRVDKFLLRVIGEDVELKTVLANERLTVMADSGQIEQVLMNLAANARDAMPQGGAFTIKTDRLYIGKEVIGSYDSITPGSYAVISVSDTGEGMNEETKQRIFEPFFTTKETGRGTGLGLAIVYGIIKQHNGVINVYSEPGLGTTFKVYLELVEVKIEGADIPGRAALPVGGAETILVAEDDTAVRDIMKVILERHGYTVIEAEDGQDAINKFMDNKDKIDLLIFDVVMPKKNGKEAYEEIKKVKGDIQAVFSSGYTDDILQKTGIIKEGLGFISKPVTPHLLLLKVRQALSR